MSFRLRSLLLVLALVALPLVGAVSIPTAAPADTREPTATATAIRELRLPERRVFRRSTPTPTIGERAVRRALRAVGVPYRWAGESPSTGFDCSGLVRWAYGRVGVELPHSSYALNDAGRLVRRSRMKPGDVLVFEGLGHVGLYLGRGRMVHAPQSGRVVEVVSLDRTSYGRRLVAARRVAPRLS